MAAYVKIVPEKEWEIIKSYLGEEGTVLIPEQVFNQLTDEQKEKITDMNNKLVNYNFGGEADIWLDVVRSPDAYFFESKCMNNDINQDMNM